MAEEQKAPKYTKPDDVPKEERVGTLMVVWTKDGQILTAYPDEIHIGTKMLSVAMDVIAAHALQKHKAALAIAREAEKRVIPATQLPSFDPRFLRKPGDS